jgi:ATP-dependent 26S proteasome regulatory subunit
MAYIYLKRWFGNLITAKQCKELAKYAATNDFSYAYLKELYISAMFEALSHNRKVPTAKDVTTALNRLVKDKNLLNNGSLNMDKYFKG